jgi:hypothetical protein
MKTRLRRIAILAGLIAAAAWWHLRTPEPTVLAFRLGKTFEQVVRNSSYPALERSNRPRDDWDGNKFGAIWGTEPSVIIHFTDPKHGFTLPPTKFAALSFSENQAITLATSPMLDPLPFDEALAILENLQNQFKAGGWEPWEMFEPGYMASTDLRIATLGCYPKTHSPAAASDEAAPSPLPHLRRFFQL